MYAIIETGGKQIRVEEGSTIFVEKLDVQEGEAVVFEPCCMSSRIYNRSEQRLSMEIITLHGES